MTDCALPAKLRELWKKNPKISILISVAHLLQHIRIALSFKLMTHFNNSSIELQLNNVLLVVRSCSRIENVVQINNNAICLILWWIPLLKEERIAKKPLHFSFAKAKCMHSLSEEEFWKERIWSELFNKLPDTYNAWPCWF